MKLLRKHTLIYISLLVYVVSVCGVTINKHFCGGELESVSLIKQNSCCGEETQDEPSDCCQDETLHLSNKTESITNNVIFNIQSFYQTPIAILHSFLFHPCLLNQYNTPVKSGVPFVRITDPSSIMVFRI
ncbi:MAG: hypothetical protein JWO32_1139 [Bacteroidetes bacterium]|nr:hypothetical protein [Bacteroidota bacterium]